MKSLPKIPRKTQLCSRYSKKSFSRKYRKGNVYFGAELKKDELYEAIEAFRKTATIKESNKYPQAEFEISGCQKWSDVEQTMRDAKVEYEKRHKGKTVAAIDNFLQTIGNSGKTFQAWMDLLPNGDYSSVICGSFKLVLNVSFAFRHVLRTYYSHSKRQSLAFPKLETWFL